MNVYFTAEEGGVVTSVTEAEEKEVFNFFRTTYVTSSELTPESMMLFKITVDERLEVMLAETATTLTIFVSDTYQHAVRTKLPDIIYEKQAPRHLVTIYEEAAAATQQQMLSDFMTTYSFHILFAPSFELGTNEEV